MGTVIGERIKVNLTSGIELSAGSHIVYTYTEEDKYLENATSFVAEGIDNKQVVIYSDRLDRLDKVKMRLNSRGFSDDQLKDVIFINTCDYFKMDGDSDNGGIFTGFHELVKPFMEKNKTIRTWGIVDWGKQKESTLIPQLKLHESRCDCLVKETKNMISVCAYDISNWSALVLSELLKVHEYHMTDEALAPSHLYNKQPVIFPSISEQIKLEKAAHGQILRSEKLSIAGQLAAGIAHEIRNPITAIKGFLKLSMTDHQDDRYLKIIADEVEKIELIASEFLILAKPHIEEKQEVDIIQLVKSVKTLMEAQALGKNIGIQIEGEHHLEEIIITCDEMKMRQVLINLIKNAIEVMENGHITLEVNEFHHDVVISITDEGPGMPQEIINQIGQPFFTTKQNGTGLGLYVCQKIIQNHNGELDVESEDGQGTTFTISLPKQ